MKNTGDVVGPYAINCTKPNESNSNARKLVNEKTFEGVWKIFVFYPNNFTYVHPEELIGFHNISQLLAKNGIILFIGSTDRGFADAAWSIISQKAGTPSLYIFTDNPQPHVSLANKLDLAFTEDRLTRVLCIVDDKDIIQFISEDDLNIVGSVTKMLKELKQISGQI
jgi:peroxiredoxin (alkyl hydroperoxide reductase subunit C)